MSTDKIPSKFLRLRENHPDLQKLNQLIELALKLKIDLYFNPWGGCDISIDGNKYQMVDSDNRENHINTFPYDMETTLLRENPEYVKYQKDLEEKRYAIEAEKTRKASEAALKAAETKKENERKAEEAKKIRVEKEEREQLKKLKEKYE